MIEALKIFIYTLVVLFLAYMLVEFVHYVARPEKDYFKDDEERLYYWKTLKALVKKVDEEDRKRKETCWYCQNVVVDLYGDGGHYCKIKKGQWVPAAGTCDDFKAEVKHEQGL